MKHQNGLSKLMTVSLLALTTSLFIQRVYIPAESCFARLTTWVYVWHCIHVGCALYMSTSMYIWQELADLGKCTSNSAVLITL